MLPNAPAGFLKQYSAEFISLSIFFFLCSVTWRLLSSKLSGKDATRPVRALKEKSKGFYGAPEDANVDFSGVKPYKPDFDVHAEEPEQWWRDGYISDRVYTATMALRNLSFDDWLRIDKNYPSRMQHKKNTFATMGAEAIDYREGGYEGCAELLAMLVEYLPRRFPTIFMLSSDGKTLHNAVTGESFEIRAPYGGMYPLEIIGRITEEDLALLTEGPDGEYVLKATVSAFPAGFDIQAKIDKPLTEIHAPVPTYKEKLQKAMNKFFKSVGASRLVMRVNWSINDREELFLVNGHLYEGDEGATANENIDINEVQLRVERQVIRRLPKSGAMCMLTKTYLYRLVDIADHPGFAARLGGLLHKLPEKFAFYKGKPVWGKVILEYLDEMAAKHPAEEEEEQA